MNQNVSSLLQVCSACSERLGLMSFRGPFHLNDSLIYLLFLILWESPHKSGAGWRQKYLSVSQCQKGTKAIFKNQHMVTKTRRTQVMGYGLTRGQAWSILARSPDRYHFNTSILVLVGFELRMCASKNGLFSKWSIFPYLPPILMLFLYSPTFTRVTLWHWHSLSGTKREAGWPGKRDVQELYNSPEERGGHSASSYLLFEAGCSQRGEGLQRLQPDHASLDLPDVGGKGHHGRLSK